MLPHHTRPHARSRANSHTFVFTSVPTDEDGMKHKQKKRSPPLVNSNRHFHRTIYVLFSTLYVKCCSCSCRLPSLKTFVYSIIAFLLFLVVYLPLLYRYGTISPIATLLYTQSYHGLAHNDYPAVDWKPPFNVIVSLTTTPARIATLHDTIQSLLEQTILPDKIYVNLPRGKMRRHPERSYDEVTIPEFMLNNSLIHINRCIDYGPATKLIATLIAENDPTTLIITVDDDFKYPKDLVGALAWESMHNEEDVIGVCGWSVVKAISLVAVYVPYFMRPNGRVVDVLQACCGNAYRRKFFSDLDILQDMPSECITVDDVWIAGVIKMIENRKEIVISKRLDPTDPQWKENEKQDAQQLKLSSYNHENHIHLKCIEAMEQRFQRKWHMNYEENEYKIADKKSGGRNRTRG